MRVYYILYFICKRISVVPHNIRRDIILLYTSADYLNFNKSTILPRRRNDCLTRTSKQSLRCGQCGIYMANVYFIHEFLVSGNFTNKIDQV